MNEPVPNVADAALEDWIPDRCFDWGWVQGRPPDGGAPLHVEVGRAVDLERFRVRAERLQRGCAHDYGVVLPEIVPEVNPALPACCHEIRVFRELDGAFTWAPEPSMVLVLEPDLIEEIGAELIEPAFGLGGVMRSKSWADEQEVASVDQSGVMATQLLQCIRETLPRLLDDAAFLAALRSAHRTHPRLVEHTFAHHFDFDGLRDLAVEALADNRSLRPLSSLLEAAGDLAAGELPREDAQTRPHAHLRPLPLGDEAQDAAEQEVEEQLEACGSYEGAMHHVLIDDRDPLAVDPLSVTLSTDLLGEDSSASHLRRRTLALRTRLLRRGVVLPVLHLVDQELQHPQAQIEFHGSWSVLLREASSEPNRLFDRIEEAIEENLWRIFDRETLLERLAGDGPYAAYGPLPDGVTIERLHRSCQEALRLGESIDDISACIARAQRGG